MAISPIPTDDLTKRVPVPPSINEGVSPARQTTMLSLLGNPAKSYGNKCAAVDHPVLKGMMVTERVGLFRVTGLKLAVDSLRDVLNDVRETDPQLYKAVRSTAGMLCVRCVRSRPHAISNHSWGTAVDLKINGELDPRGENTVQAGLVALAPYFNKHLWYWGAGFGTEDGMHFECSDQKLKQWHAEGKIGQPGTVLPDMIAIGDRGPEVKMIQAKLAEAGQNITVDGIFGPATRAAVTAFQTERNLVPSGTVDDMTLVELNKTATVQVASASAGNP